MKTSIITRLQDSINTKTGWDAPFIVTLGAAFFIIGLPLRLAYDSLKWLGLF